jgi:hypothetical protein
MEDLSMIKILLDSESFARKADDHSSEKSTHSERSTHSETSTHSEKALLKSDIFSRKPEKRMREDDDSKTTDTLSVSFGKDESKVTRILSRAGKPWTAEEHTAFRNLILDGCSRDIAEMKMQRKHTALDAMARKLISSRLASGHSMDDICEFLKKTPDQIQNVLAGESFFESV